MVITMILFFLNNIIIWYQLNSQLVWDWAKTPKAMWLSALLGVPISIIFWYCTKFGYEGFGGLWPVRLMGFAAGMITFPFITWIMLGEGITLRTGISLLLATIIMLLQFIKIN